MLMQSLMKLINIHDYSRKRNTENICEIQETGTEDDNMKAIF